MEISTWAPNTLRQLSTDLLCSTPILMTSAPTLHGPQSHWIPSVNLGEIQVANITENDTLMCVSLMALSVCEGIKRACVAAAKLCACLSHNPGLIYRPQMLGASSRQLRRARVQYVSVNRFKSGDVHSLGCSLSLGVALLRVKNLFCGIKEWMALCVELFTTS